MFRLSKKKGLSEKVGRSIVIAIALYRCRYWFGTQAQDPVHSYGVLIEAIR